jgi:glycosyltransferase involved in cell wall biosynthesis
MRIALVSKTNGCFGGASFFAENLAGWLADAGHDVAQFCVEPRRELRPWQRPLPVAGLASRLVRHANWRARRWGMVEPLPWEYWFGLRDQIDQFELVHFHDLYMAISPRTLKAVARRKPVVFTVHDTSAFTGGCLNPLGCERFQRECGACPQKSELGRLDFSRSNLRLARKSVRTSGLNLVFPSRWIQGQAGRSLQWTGRAEHIPNGFDSGKYQFCARQEAREALGLPQNRKIVSISSAALENKLKGFGFALEAVMANRDLNPLAVLIGHSPSAVEKLLEGVSCHVTGFVEDRERMGLFLAAADLLLYPSLGDNLPVTIQEAMAAGTPVLAFDVGGVPELVQPGKTGWLAPAGDQETLNRTLREILQSDETSHFGERARALIHDDFSAARCLDRHTNFYREILGGIPSRNGHS